MPRYDSIITNLPLCTPPGLHVTLWELADAYAVLRIQRADLVFLLRSNRPELFGFPGSAKAVGLLFIDAVAAWDRRANELKDLARAPIANLR